MPEIDVPSYLPDLPGIAADLMYSADLGPGIAPSAPSSAIPELPTFNTESVENFRPGTLTPFVWGSSRRVWGRPLGQGGDGYTGKGAVSK